MLLFFKCGPNPASFVYFRPFLDSMTNIVHNLTINGTSIDGVREIQTQDRRIVGPHESTEL